MWYRKFNFIHRREGLSEMPEPDFFSKPLTAEELERYPDIATLYPQLVSDPDRYLPPALALPEELLQLLLYSNGGVLIHGEREFSFFALEEIRYYYFAYGFPEYMPSFLPIAFNGGGIFYAYDLREQGRAPVMAVASGNPFAEEAVLLGHSLEAVCNQTTNIETLLYAAIQTVTDEGQMERIALKKQLEQLNAAKEKGQIDLKTYLKEKRVLEKKLNGEDGQ